MDMLLFELACCQIKMKTVFKTDIYYSAIATTVQINIFGETHLDYITAKLFTLKSLSMKI